VDDDTVVFVVPDSREGWAQAVAQIEVMAFKKNTDKTLVLDFSKVRPKGAPIGGMQGRPASGPIPFMHSIYIGLKEAQQHDEPWKQAMIIDHWLADCVRVGGARRSARIAVKYWKDPTVIGFIEFKRPEEYAGMSVDEIIEYNKTCKYQPYAKYYSSNNSVLVDKEFWDSLEKYHKGDRSDLAVWAHKVFTRITESSYYEVMGEPGIINVDRLTDKGRDQIDFDAVLNGMKNYPKTAVDDQTMDYLAAYKDTLLSKKYIMIVNPCGEINLSIMGGLCVIGDTLPFHADTLDEAEDAFRTTARALIRINRLDAFYQAEVNRTNRIGVSMTGIHEFMWKFFKVAFRESLKPDFDKWKQARDAGENTQEHPDVAVRAADFWMTLNRFHLAVEDEVRKYSAKLGVTIPHTALTIKPAGTTSKLFGVSEGAHLPAYAYYMRWVQFEDHSQLVDEYEQKGYPVIRKLKTYSGVSLVGFPTALRIAALDIPKEKMVLAGQATMEEQFQWLMLLERFYIDGVDPETMKPLESKMGSQVSYTLKYDPKSVSFDDFVRAIAKYQKHIKCVSVLPQADTSSYEYLPEDPITKEEYEYYTAEIKRREQGEHMVEDIGYEH
ncbi:MAG: ribonucleoside-diphosphate reductase, partial [Gammaproteobacteria bacterium]